MRNWEVEFDFTKFCWNVVHSFFHFLVYSAKRIICDGFRKVLLQVLLVLTDILGAEMGDKVNNSGTGSSGLVSRPTDQAMKFRTLFWSFLWPCLALINRQISKITLIGVIASNS